MPRTSPDIPRTGPIKVAAKALGEQYFCAKTPGYLKFVRLHFEELEIDIAALRHLGGKRPGKSITFDDAVDILYSAEDPALWSKCVGGLVCSAYAKLNKGGVGPFWSGQVLPVLKQIIELLHAESIEVGPDGRLTQVDTGIRFLSESIFGACKSAPIERGDLQINETMGRLSDYPDGTIFLDMGAGKGRALSELATMHRFSRWKYVGVNVNDEDTKQLAQLIKENGLNKNSKSILLADFKKRSMKVDVAFCINVLHGLSNSQILEVLKDLTTFLRPGALLILHEMTIMHDGEPRFLSWDAEMAAELISESFDNIGGRDFESRKGLPLMTVSGRKASTFHTSIKVLHDAMARRKERLWKQLEEAKDPALRAKLNEYYVQLDRRIIAANDHPKPKPRSRSRRHGSAKQVQPMPTASPGSGTERT